MNKLWILRIVDPVEGCRFVDGSRRADRSNMKDCSCQTATFVQPETNVSNWSKPVICGRGYECPDVVGCYRNIAPPREAIMSKPADEPGTQLVVMLDQAGSHRAGTLAGYRTSPC